MLRRLIQQGASVIGLRIVGTALSVAVTIVIARSFGPEALGIYAYCVTIMALACVPVSSGWASMLLRSVAHEGALSAENVTIRRLGLLGAVAMAVLAGLVALAVLPFASGTIAGTLRQQSTLIVALLALVMAADQIAALRMACIRGIDRPALAQLPEMLIRPGLLILGVLAFALTIQTGTLADTMAALFAVLAAAALASAVFGQIVLARLTGTMQGAPVTWHKFTTWAASAAALAGSAGLVQLNGYIDFLVFGAFGQADDLGIYRAGLQIALLSSFGYVALNMLAGQRFARLRGEQDWTALGKSATMLARLALLASLPIPLAIGLFGEQILNLLFGDGFGRAAFPALLVSFGFCFSAGIGMAHSMLIMHHRERLALAITGVALAINLLACLLLIPRFGIVGAASANLVATISWNAILWVAARKTSGFDTSVIGLARRPVQSAEERGRA